MVVVAGVGMCLSYLWLVSLFWAAGKSLDSGVSLTVTSLALESSLDAFEGGGRLLSVERRCVWWCKCVVMKSGNLWVMVSVADTLRDG